MPSQLTILSLQHQRQNTHFDQNLRLLVYIIYCLFCCSCVVCLFAKGGVKLLEASSLPPSSSGWDASSSGDGEFRSLNIRPTSPLTKSSSSQIVGRPASASVLAKMTGRSWLATVDQLVVDGAYLTSLRPLVYSILCVFRI